MDNETFKMVSDMILKARMEANTISCERTIETRKIFYDRLLQTNHMIFLLINILSANDVITSEQAQSIYDGYVEYEKGIDVIVEDKKEADHD